MSKIAIIKTGGKQYKVKEGQTIKVEKIKKEKDETIKLETLLISKDNGDSLSLGQPNLEEQVEAKIIDQGRDKKTRVIKYKNKTRYRRNFGHKQMFTLLKIEKI